MLDRNKRAMRELIRRIVPGEEAGYFEDYIDDDGMGMGPYKIACTHVARGRQVHLRLRRHRPAIDLLDQLPPERRDVQDVPGRLHDQAVRPADPVQRRLLRPGRRAHSRRHDPEAAEARGALLPHAHARAHLRHHGRPARPGRSRAHVRGRLLRQPALHVFGLQQERRVVPALPDRLRRHSRPPVRRRARRAFAVAGLHQRAERIPRELFPAAHRHLRDDPRLRRPGAPRRQRHPHRLPVPGAGRNLDPRRPLADLSLGRQRRHCRARAAEDAGARRRQRAAPALEVRPRQGRAGRPARLQHLGRRRLGRSVRARACEGGLRRRSRPGQRAGCAALRRRAEERQAGREGDAALRERMAAERGAVPLFDRGFRDIDELKARCKAETGLEPPTAPQFQARIARKRAAAPARSARG